MAFDFKDEDKEVREFKESMSFGLHKVQLVGATAGETEAGKDFIELTIVNVDGVEDAARCWFTGGATNISFNTLRDIAVHVSKDEEEKQAARDAVDAMSNSEELADYLNEKCAGGELWFTKYYDAERTYQDRDGNVRRSVNKNVYGYEPKLKPELMPSNDKDTLNKVFPGAETLKDDAAGTVPSGDSWAK